MGFDSLKGGVSDYKNKKADLKKQEEDLSVNIEKADDLIESTAGVDDNISDLLKQVRAGLDIHQAELRETGDLLEQEKADLQEKINDEQSKLNAVQKKIDGLAGKKYTGELDNVSQRCDALLAELNDMLTDLDEDSGPGSISDSAGTAGKRVKIGDDYYRVDDNGNPHMKRGDDKEYHVLPNTKYVVNGYTYQSDEDGRIIHAEGLLKVKNGERASLNAQVDGMGASDQRGHIIADVLGGSNQNDNLVAQLQTINQGRYKILENDLASMIDSGHSVYGDYSITYPDNSKRPSSITVNYTIGEGDSLSQLNTFTKLGLSDTYGYTELENNLDSLRVAGHSVNCSYSVVFSNDTDDCWVFMEYSVDGGFPVLSQFS